MKIVIPFTFGRGKTGNAKTGEKRALIIDTVHYQNAFADFKNLVKHCEAVYRSNFSEIAESPNFARQLLGLLKDNGVQIQEADIFGKEVIFLNLDAFKSSEFQRLLSVEIDGQKIYI